MKNNLPKISLLIGVSVWLIMLFGYTYFIFFYPNKADYSGSIIPTNVLIALVIMLVSVVTSIIGVICGITALILLEKSKKTSWLAIAINSTFIIPMFILFVS